jgi:hypothetical protein
VSSLHLLRTCSFRGPHPFDKLAAKPPAPQGYRPIFKCSRCIRSGGARKLYQLLWLSFVLSGERGRSTIVSVPVPNRRPIVLTRSPLSVII